MNSSNDIVVPMPEDWFGPAGTLHKATQGIRVSINGKAITLEAETPLLYIGPFEKTWYDNLEEYRFQWTFIWRNKYIKLTMFVDGVDSIEGYRTYYQYLKTRVVPC